MLGPNGKRVARTGTNPPRRWHRRPKVKHLSKSNESYGMIQPMVEGTPSPKPRRALLRLLSITAAGSLILTGCVSGTHDGSKEKPSEGSPTDGNGNAPPSKMPALQSRTFQTSDKDTLQVDVLSLARLGSDKLKLQLRISNVGQEDASTVGTFSNGQNYDNIGGFVLLDGQNMKAYFPLTSAQGNVMQSGYTTDNETISPGSGIYPSLFFPAPSGVSKVDIASPSAPAFNDIPIRGTASVKRGEPNPEQVQLKPPDIENLTNISDDLNGDKSIDQNNNGEAVQLNADVLFALNKAKLTDKAQAILKDVAERIDKAKTSTIKVDGYTDSSGNDAINNPLSRRRAEAVASALKKMVSRSGVSYQTAGHGSADPIATNGSSEGRQKNRRVTVTIGK